MDTILVTGGAGFIGSHLCERFVNVGNRVVCFDNFDDYYSPDIKWSNIADLCNEPNFTMIQGDILDRVKLKELFARFEFTKVVHLAAKVGVRPSLQDPARYADVNVRGTINVLEECVRYPSISKFLFASSSSVYGNNTRLPFSETESVGEPISPYAATKRSGELLCYTYHSLYNIPIVCCRFFTVYGPRQRPDMAIHKFVRSILLEEEIVLFGNGSTARDYTYIDDIVNGIARILDAEYRYDIVNLGESTIVSLHELVACIEQALGKKATIRYIEKAPSDVNITFADITKAKMKYGYDPKCSVEEGVERFVKWYQDTVARTMQYVWNHRLL
ncbi:MAG: GDP-mannose 4,6-dehydratase [Ignavibacteriae bacterium]|nr:GDP-mannose 4,6-dehydratase [Ignavibacteriota bacterium]